MAESGVVTPYDVQVLVQIQKWWELRHKRHSPEWVVLSSALPDDIAGRGHVAGLSETGPDGKEYSEVSLYYELTVNGKALPWTFEQVVKILLHENAHNYYQSKGRFPKRRVSTPKEERIVDVMADKDLRDFTREHPELTTWFPKSITKSEEAGLSGPKHTTSDDD